MHVSRMASLAIWSVDVWGSVRIASVCLYILVVSLLLLLSLLEFALLFVVVVVVDDDVACSAVSPVGSHFLDEGRGNNDGEMCR